MRFFDWLSGRKSASAPWAETTPPAPPSLPKADPPPVQVDRFAAFMPWILQWETVFLKGHYGDDKYVRVERDPDDPGGTTKYGIDYRSHPHVDIANLTKDQATDLYHTEWIKADCAAMPSKYGEVYFNARVNCGSGRAYALSAAAPTDPAQYIQAQRDFYARLAEARPVDVKYLKGWDNRLDDLVKWLHISS